MLRQALVAALFAVNLTNGFYTTSVNDDAIGGMPGGLQMFLNVKSMNTVVQDAAKIMSYYVLRGKSFNPDLDINLKGLELKINQVNITEAKFGDVSMDFVGTTDVVRTTITNANITLAVDAEATSSIFPIPLDITEVFLQNVTMQLDLTTSSDDQLIWQVQETLLLSLQDFEITCKEKFWQKKLDALKPEAQKLIDYGLKFASGVIAGLVDVFNVDLKNEGPNTFVFDVSSLIGMGVPMPFNLTMSKAPEFSNEKGEILLHIDGDFTSKDMSQYVPQDTIWADYAAQKQKEQLWIHQSVINSALYDAQMTLAGEGFQTKIKVLLAELWTYYGADTDCEGVLTFPKEPNSQPIAFSKAKGITVGDDSEGGLKLTLNMMCAKDKTAEKELAVVLNTGVHVAANITWDNFEYWADLTEPTFMDTTCVSQKSDLVLDWHNWNQELTAVMKDITDDFDLRWATPHDLKTKKGPIPWPMIAGLVKATLLSPFVADEFLFIGFKMIMDQ